MMPTPAVLAQTRGEPRFGPCQVSGKISYRDYQDAVAAIEGMGRLPVSRVYRCHSCHRLHITRRELVMARTGENT